MTAKRLLMVTGLLAVLMLAPSCRLFHKQKPAPPAPAPVPAQPAPPEKKPEEVTIPAPPAISPQHPNLEQGTPPQTSGQELPPPPRKRRGTKARVKEVPAEQSPEPQAAPPAEEPAAPVPELAQILTPEQRQAYQDEIEANIGRAQKAVDGIQNRMLTREQKTDLARVREFIQQAKEARKSDLFRARNLAERASILAEDLSRNIQ